MKSSSAVKLGYLLVLISLFLIGFGGYLSYKDNTKLDPIEDIISSNDKDGNNVIITTNDGLPPATNGNNTNNGSVNGNNGNNTNNDSGNGNNGNVTVNDNSVNNNDNTGTSSNTTSPKTTEDIVTEPTIEEKIDIYRKSIEDTFGIRILYGNEVEGYRVGDMDTTVIPDNDTIQSTLEQLNDALLKYPEGFFREFSDNNVKLYFFLIKNYSSANVTGVTDFNLQRITVSIATDFPLVDTFHHEMLHCIEYYIEKNGGKFSSWNVFNPTDFVYGNEIGDYSYNRTGKADSYFVNNYAQSSATEDRASTFEYMTAKVKYSCFDSKNYPIWKKSEYISSMIETYFSTVSPEVIDYWERYVY